ncbi:urease accessory protein [Spirosoma pollinicola]|uniref:Urease accessory protein n=1 Tax=Spirosoma pollinicola TaxID=2057025 RepID=A0A2K8Z6M2_9BACT|nr:urease accessory protein [Spirosoma pollinicola]AUD05510.1 urease accessory protein [Spirosoma pollinicola]
MQTLLPLLLALGVGFMHAFEADHLVAVSNIVTRRNNIRLALKDGVFWGLGHTSTILIVGSIFMLGKLTLHESDFRFLEAGVGVMLVTLGGLRLYKLAHLPMLELTASHGHTHTTDGHAHGLAYGVGLIHGLAGSGALILSVLTQIKGTGAGMLYLVLFGIGSIGGMMVAAGVFSVPFSVRLLTNPAVRTGLVVLSSMVCIGLGAMVVYENALT